jgi:hypothetical protein
MQFGGEPFEIYDYYYSYFPYILKVRKILLLKGEIKKNQ